MKFITAKRRIESLQTQCWRKTLVQNRALGGLGGAIYASHAGATFEVTNSTISENFASLTGGGMYLVSGGRGPADSEFQVSHSTIAYNSGPGGGGHVAGDGIVAASYAQVFVDHSIVANNGVDLATTGASSFSLDYALIGAIQAGASVSANHLQLGRDPLLQQLAPDDSLLVLPENRRLLTHALRAGSPAIDAGDPSLAAGVGDTPQFDQRGAPHARVAIGSGATVDRPVVDLGAYEFALQADYNRDRRVSGRDFLIWQRSVGRQSRASYEEGDSTGDLIVDERDLAVWEHAFGFISPGSRGGGRLRATTEALAASDLTSLNDVAALQSSATEGGQPDMAPTRRKASRTDQTSLQYRVSAREALEQQQGARSSFAVRRPSVMIAVDDMGACVRAGRRPGRLGLRESDVDVG